VQSTPVDSSQPEVVVASKPASVNASVNASASTTTTTADIMAGGGIALTAVILGGVLVLLAVPVAFAGLGALAAGTVAALVYVLVIRPRYILTALPEKKKETYTREPSSVETYEEELERRILALKMPSPPRRLAEAPSASAPSASPLTTATRRYGRIAASALAGAAETYLPPRVQAAIHGARRASYGTS
jgi:hypothetical protein